MDALTQTLAQYLLSLFRASEGTHRAEDRPLYRMYLAEAGVLRALAVMGAERERLRRHFAQHGRLWGQTWLHDPVYEGPSVGWQERKRVYRTTGCV
ncbi:MAG TPA: hypothetical protein VLK82_13335 [Candidatus Tectomicrobia bacterium]|nr:hypothetical protein [Candidatus Tectomicrobia bacterium]